MQTEPKYLPASCRRLWPNSWPILWPVLLCMVAAACSTTPPEASVTPPAPAVAAPPGTPPAPPATEIQSVVPAVVLPAATRHALIAALAYRQGLQGMSASEMTRERNQLTAQAGNPENQMRLALLYAQTRTPAGDPGKALALAESLLKSNDPAAVALHPLAALLVEQLTERVRLEGQHERQLAQARENQRRIHDLQEKLERLANIERSLPARTPPPAPAGKQP